MLVSPSAKSPMRRVNSEIRLVILFEANTATADTASKATTDTNIIILRIPESDALTSDMFCAATTANSTPAKLNGITVICLLMPPYSLEIPLVMALLAKASVTFSESIFSLITTGVSEKRLFERLKPSAPTKTASPVLPKPSGMLSSGSMRLCGICTTKIPRNLSPPTFLISIVPSLEILSTIAPPL